MISNYSNQFAKVLIVAFLHIVILGAVATADVSPGDKIDKTNWQKVEGMLPESVLNYVKKGDFILDIGELKVDTDEFFPLATRQLLKSNVGKYKLSDKGEIVDANTGKAIFVEGIPFPQIDTADPQAAIKIVYNMHYGRHVSGNINFDVGFFWVARSGLERTVKGKYYSYIYSGYPEAKNIPNPNGYERQNIISITEPYDIQGTNVMLWRYLDARRDNNYSYVPAIRRIRRLSPASRSDAFLGSDFSLDDTASYDGKVPDFEWKLIRTQEALIPYVSEGPQEIVPDANSGGVTLSKSAKKLVYGFQQEGWKGAPWAPTNAVWVKRKTYVVEGKPRDPYYNYGSTILWLDASRCAATYKINFDRANKYWKAAVQPLYLVANKDGSYKSIEWGGLVMVDDRRDHATISVQCNPDENWAWQAKNMNTDDFTLGGFQKLNK